MVGNGGSITGCLIHRVSKYSGFPGACVRFPFPVLPSRKEICHNSNTVVPNLHHDYVSIQVQIPMKVYLSLPTFFYKLRFCRWLRPNW